MRQSDWNPEKLKNHKPSLIGIEECRKAAVTIPMLPAGQGYDILFEVRSGNVDSQPGDICLPGGMLEPGETPKEAAVRETMEELLVERQQIEILGLMDVNWTGSGMMMYPYAALLKAYEETFSADEVSEVFCVPLSFFLTTEPEAYRTQAKVIPDENFPYERIHGGENYGWRTRSEKVLFYQYGDRTIWGLTARIMHSFAAIIRAEIPEISQTPEAEDEPAGADEPAANPWLIRFLDADTLDEKYEVLTEMYRDIDDKLIDDLAVCLDVVIPEGKTEDRYRQLKHCVRTRQKYEGSFTRKSGI